MPLREHYYCVVHKGAHYYCIRHYYHLKHVWHFLFWGVTLYGDIWDSHRHNIREKQNGTVKGLVGLEICVEARE